MPINVLAPALGVRTSLALCNYGDREALIGYDSYGVFRILLGDDTVFYHNPDTRQTLLPHYTLTGSQILNELVLKNGLNEVYYKLTHDSSNQLLLRRGYDSSIFNIFTVKGPLGTQPTLQIDSPTVMEQATLKSLVLSNQDLTYSYSFNTLPSGQIELRDLNEATPVFRYSPEGDNLLAITPHVEISSIGGTAVYQSATAADADNKKLWSAAKSKEYVDAAQMFHDVGTITPPSSTTSYATGISFGATTEYETHMTFKTSDYRAMQFKQQKGNNPLMFRGVRTADPPAFDVWQTLLSEARGDIKYAAKSDATISGTLTLSGTPGSIIANGYDGAGVIKKGGATINDTTVWSGSKIDDELKKKLDLAGGTMTGSLTTPSITTGEGTIYGTNTFIPGKQIFFASPDVLTDDVDISIMGPNSAALSLSPEDADHSRYELCARNSGLADNKLVLTHYDMQGGPSTEIFNFNNAVVDPPFNFSVPTKVPSLITGDVKMWGTTSGGRLMNFEATTDNSSGLIFHSQNHTTYLALRPSYSTLTGEYRIHADTLGNLSFRRHTSAGGAELARFYEYDYGTKITTIAGQLNADNLGGSAVITSDDITTPVSNTKVWSSERTESEMANTRFVTLNNKLLFSASENANGFNASKCEVIKASDDDVNLFDPNPIVSYLDVHTVELDLLFPINTGAGVWEITTDTTTSSFNHYDFVATYVATSDPSKLRLNITNVDNEDIYLLTGGGLLALDVKITMSYSAIVKYLQEQMTTHITTKLLYPRKTPELRYIQYASDASIFLYNRYMGYIIRLKSDVIVHGVRFHCVEDVPNSYTMDATITEINMLTGEYFGADSVATLNMSTPAIGELTISYSSPKSYTAGTILAIAIKNRTGSPSMEIRTTETTPINSNVLYEQCHRWPSCMVWGPDGNLMSPTPLTDQIKLALDCRPLVSFKEYLES